MRLNKFAFILLSVLEEHQCFNMLNSISCYQIQKDIAVLDYTINYINITMKKFLKEEYVKRGLDDRRSHTYYLTEKGKELLNEMRN